MILLNYVQVALERTSALHGESVRRDFEYTDRVVLRE